MEVRYKSGGDGGAEGAPAEGAVHMAVQVGRQRLRGPGIEGPGRVLTHIPAGRVKSLNGLVPGPLVG